jgi:hypothetical protein
VKKMTIKSIQILLTAGTDKVLFNTDLPSSMPGVTSALAHMEMNVAQGSGMAYVARHFPGIPAEVIDTRPQPQKTRTVVIGRKLYRLPVTE